MSDHRSDALVAPAVARNRDPILAVLRQMLPTEGMVLEIASGSGEHAVYFAAGLPNLTWQPTDVDPVALKSISAHRDLAALPNLQSPVKLDLVRSGGANRRGGEGAAARGCAVPLWTFPAKRAAYGAEQCGF